MDWDLFEEGDALYGVPYVTTPAYRGVALRAYGWEVEDDEDTEWTGMQSRTGRVVCEMVGDDRLMSFDVEDLTPLPRSAFCGECGQIGCHCDGYEEDDEE